MPVETCLLAGTHRAAAATLPGCGGPRFTRHSLDNTATQDAKFLAVATPALMTPNYFREIHEVLADGPPDPAKVGEIMRRHGLTPAPPAA